MPKYTEKDAVKDTKSPISEVKEAWHEARNDSQDTVERSIHKLEQMERDERKADDEKSDDRESEQSEKQADEELK